MSNPHPQATTTVGTGGIGLVLVWALGRFGVELNSEEGLLVGGALTSVALLVGRKGLKGIVAAVWHGNGK